MILALPVLRTLKFTIIDIYNKLHNVTKSLSTSYVSHPASMLQSRSAVQQWRKGYWELKLWSFGRWTWRASTLIAARDHIVSRHWWCTAVADLPNWAISKSNRYERKRHPNLYIFSNEEYRKIHENERRFTKTNERRRVITCLHLPHPRSFVSTTTFTV